MSRNLTAAVLIILTTAHLVIGGLGQGLLLCLHDDLSVHLKESEAAVDQCKDTHGHVEAACHGEACSDCVDIYLMGQEEVPVLSTRTIPLAMPVAQMLPGQLDLLTPRIEESGKSVLVRAAPPCRDGPLQEIQRTILLRL